MNFKLLFSILAIFTMANKAWAAPSTVSLTFSTNATTIENGQPFTAACEISGFDGKDNDLFNVLFMRTNGSLAAYETKGKRNLDRGE